MAAGTGLRRVFLQVTLKHRLVDANVVTLVDVTADRFDAVMVANVISYVMTKTRYEAAKHAAVATLDLNVTRKMIVVDVLSHTKNRTQMQSSQAQIYIRSLGWEVGKY